MAAVEDEVDDHFNDIDIESLLSRAQRRPLTFNRKKSVYIAPEFTRRLKGEETVDEGSDLTLTFKVNGVPRPTLRWFKDDEEVKDHPRLTVEEGEDGSYRLTLHQVNKGDEAAYRCRAENQEGTCSCCFFLSVKGKPKTPKRDSKNCHKRTVSYPTMFSTIVEKVEEEETAGIETSRAPESPLTPFYDSLTLKARSTWPSFLGDWAFVNGTHKARGGSTGSYPSSGSEGETGNPEDLVREFADAEGWEPDDVFLDSPEAAGQDSDVTEAQDVVFLLQASEHRAHGVGAVPSDVDRASASAAPRGKARPVLKLSVAGHGRNDSKEVSSSSSSSSRDAGCGSGSGGGGGKSVTSSSPADPIEVGGGKGRPVVGGKVAAKTAVAKDKAKQPATKGPDTKHGPRPSGLPNSSSSSSSRESPSPSSSSSSSTAGPAGNEAESRPKPSQKNASPSAPSSSRGPPGAGQALASGRSARKTVRTAAAPSGRPPGDFSLSAGNVGDGLVSERPLSVRGPLGALISSGGDAGRKRPTPTPSRGFSPSAAGRKSPGSSAPSPKGKAPSVAITPPPAIAAPATPAAAAAVVASGVGPPKLLVTTAPKPKPPGGPSKMCDRENQQRYVCECSDLSSGGSAESGVRAPGAAGAKPHQRGGKPDGKPDGKPGGKPGGKPDEKGGDSVASPSGEDSDPSWIAINTVASSSREDSKPLVMVATLDSRSPESGQPCGFCRKALEQGRACVCLDHPPPRGPASDSRATVAVASDSSAPSCVTSGTGSPISVTSGTGFPISVTSGTGSPISVTSGSRASSSVTSYRGPSPTSVSSSTPSSSSSSTPSAASSSAGLEPMYVREEREPTPIPPALSAAPGPSLSPPTSTCATVAPCKPCKPCVSLGLPAAGREREEREPTPIPPDSLLITHNPTGNAVLIQIYQGEERPPSVGPPSPPPPPPPSNAGKTAQPGEPLETPAKQAPMKETPIKSALKKTPRAESPVKETPGKPLRTKDATWKEMPVKETPWKNRPGILAPLEEVPGKEASLTDTRGLETPRKETRGLETPMEETPAARSASSLLVITRAAEPGKSSSVVKIEMGRDESNLEVLYPMQIPVQHVPEPAEPEPAVPEQRPEPSPTEANAAFLKRPGETRFTRPLPEQMEEQQQQSPPPPPLRLASAQLGASSKSPALSSLEVGSEALYFDPVHQELLHVKRLNPDHVRAASSILKPKPCMCKDRRSGPVTRKYFNIADDPERDLVYQYFRELAFILLLLTFLGLIFNIKPHIFVGVVLGVHLCLFFSRKYIFVRKLVSEEEGQEESCGGRKSGI